MLFKPRATSKFSDLSVETLAAFSRAQAIIDFSPDGTILTANQNFLDAMGYRLEEVKGDITASLSIPPKAPRSNIDAFGKPSAKENSRPASLSGSEKVEKKYGFKLPIIPFWTRRGVF